MSRRCVIGMTLAFSATIAAVFAGDIEMIATGLSFPTAMTFGPARGRIFSMGC